MKDSYPLCCLAKLIGQRKTICLTLKWGVILIFFVLSVAVAAQSPTLCHMELQDTTATGGELTDCIDTPGPFFVRVQPHIIRRTNQTGGCSEIQVRNALKNLDEFFSQMNIYFVGICDSINYIDNDTFFRKAIVQNCALWETYGNPDAINIFFDDTEFVQDTASLDVGGIAVDFATPGMVIAGTWTLAVNGEPIASVDSKIVEHEMGHCLGLFHTHHDADDAGANSCTGDIWPGANEDSTNCDDEGGDGCCDTPVDPHLLWKVNEYCEWVEPIQGYNPDTRNIMAATAPRCMTYFTSCQAGKMRCSLKEGPRLQPTKFNVEDTLIISGNVTWSTGSVPYGGEFVITDFLIIESGASLTIEEGVQVHFAEDAEVVVEPNAALYLHGALTSRHCNATWKGISVYGDSTKSQFIQSGGYYQGLLAAFPGSMIENAEIGVRLWGPDIEDSGGRIRCDSTIFRNNQIGVFFQPYENIHSGQPHPYRGSFRHCQFTIDSLFLFDNFYYHAALDRVDGIRFAGCLFEHAREVNVNPKQYSYGHGIAAFNSGFSVYKSQSSQETPMPCLPGECTSLEPCILEVLDLAYVHLLSVPTGFSVSTRPISRIATPESR